jgi:ABC-type transport system involved in cytochrome c biogenesis permease subunit
MTSKWIPTLVVSFFGLYLVSTLPLPPDKSGFHVNAFGALPVLSGGRIKPMDTLARTSLLTIRGKQTLRTDKKTLSATEWLLDVLYRPEKADAYPVFQIDDPDVLGLMGIEQGSQRYFSFNDLKSHLALIDAQATQAEAVKSDQQDRFQRAIISLRQRMVLYQKLESTLQLSGAEHVQDEYKRYTETLAPLYLTHMHGNGKNKVELLELLRNVERYKFLEQAAEFYPIPTDRGMVSHTWVSVGRALLDALTVSPQPDLFFYAQLGDAWRAQRSDSFNGVLAARPASSLKIHLEQAFNNAEPFYQSMLLYVVVFLLAFVSWLAWGETLRRCAFGLLLLSFAVHTVGLIARMWFQGRPPVTNLYSSAIFVGWVSVLLGITLERFYRNGIGSAMSAMIGFVTLIIAHHLAVQGDTLEMMRAVLDSNFWLATHVVTITVGYGSTFLAGFLAAAYLIRRAWDKKWNEPTAANLERMTYGIVCFSLFFSFVGTILGGIWADQSWGRFWGWDPKENGALMIVLWNAFVLHARVGGFARRDAIMVMAVFGNIVTAFSWFGVNMLGIGLHSYGFMDKAFSWLVVFSLIQLAIMSLIILPNRFRARRKT